MGKHRRNAGEPPGGDYAVGYKRTPVRDRYPPGKSGNPSGRPKKVKNEKEVLEGLLGKTYKFGDTTLTGIEILGQRLFKDAAEGKVGQTRTLFQRLDANGIGRDDDAPDLTAEDEEILADVFAQIKGMATKPQGNRDDD